MYKNRSDKYIDWLFLKKEDKHKFVEGLKLSDLTKHSGISNFTKPFMIDRRKIKGTGNRSAKLIDCVLNEKENWVMFQFLSEPTYNEEEPIWKETDPKKRFQLIKTKTYEQDIKILGIFDWLKAFEGSELTIKDLKDILKISEIQVWCYCPMQWWQGVSYYLTQEFDGSVYPNNIKPERWNVPHNNGDGLICKHLDLIFSSISFFINPMTSMLNKKLKDRNLI